MASEPSPQVPQASSERRSDPHHFRRGHYLGPHGIEASKLLYDRLIAEYLAAGRPAPRSNHVEEETVRRILASYWRFAQAYYVKNGEQTHEVDAIRVIIADVKKLYGNGPASEFGPKALKTVRQTWIDRGQVRSTVNKNMRRLARIFKWAVAEELVSPADYPYAMLATTVCEKLQKFIEQQTASCDGRRPRLPQLPSSYIQSCAKWAGEAQQAFGREIQFLAKQYPESKPSICYGFEYAVDVYPLPGWEAAIRRAAQRLAA